MGWINDGSLVLRIEYGKTAFLLAGDAEAKAESEMLASRQPLGVNLLKVGHHGSRTATTNAFLRAVKPKWAAISVGANNRSGYPHPEVLKRLEGARTQVLRTDANGNISCISDGESVDIEGERSYSP